MAAEDITLEVALFVLKSAPTSDNVTIVVSADNTVTLVKDGKPEVIIMTVDPVPHQLIKRFVYKYGIRREYFFHPEWCVKGNSSSH